MTDLRQHMGRSRCPTQTSMAESNALMLQISWECMSPQAPGHDGPAAAHGEESVSYSGLIRIQFQGLGQRAIMIQSSWESIVRVRRPLAMTDLRQHMALIKSCCPCSMLPCMECPAPRITLVCQRPCRCFHAFCCPLCRTFNGCLSVLLDTLLLLLLSPSVILCLISLGSCKLIHSLMGIDCMSPLRDLSSFGACTQSSREGTLCMSLLSTHAL